MTKQRFETVNDEIRQLFSKVVKENNLQEKQRLELSWSNWGFGRELLQDSAARLAANGLKYIELHGNHYGADLGYKPSETLSILGDHGLKVGGVCGMFSHENDLSSSSAVMRQRAVDYIKRELEFSHAVNADYMLVVPGAVGRPQAYDECEFERSVETLLLVADLFVQAGVKAAIEPIRAAEVSFCHTFKDAKNYISAVNHPGIAHINGDVYHM